MALSRPPVIAFVPDLMVSVRLTEAARVAGQDVTIVADGAWPAAVASGASVAVVDLSAGPMALTAVAEAVAAGIPTLAFGPHMDEAALSAARSLGALAVMPRGRFLADPAAAWASLVPA